MNVSFNQVLESSALQSRKQRDFEKVKIEIAECLPSEMSHGRKRSNQIWDIGHFIESIWRLKNTLKRRVLGAGVDGSEGPIHHWLQGWAADAMQHARKFDRAMRRERLETRLIFRSVWLGFLKKQEF